MGNNGATRVLKVATGFAFLVLISTRLGFYMFNGKDFSKMLGRMDMFPALLVYALLAIFGATSLLSIPITATAGVVGMATSKRDSPAPFFLGFLTCLLSAANLLLWIKYGGLPIKIPGCDWCAFHPGR